MNQAVQSCKTCPTNNLQKCTVIIKKIWKHSLFKYIFYHLAVWLFGTSVVALNKVGTKPAASLSGLASLYDPSLKPDRHCHLVARPWKAMPGLQLKPSPWDLCVMQ